MEQVVGKDGQTKFLKSGAKKLKKLKTTTKKQTKQMQQTVSNYAANCIKLVTIVTVLLATTGNECLQSQEAAVAGTCFGAV